MKSGKLIPPILLFFKLFQLFFLSFHINFRILSISTKKNLTGVLMGIVLNRISIWRQLTSFFWWFLQTTNMVCFFIYLDSLWFPSSASYSPVHTVFDLPLLLSGIAFLILMSMYSSLIWRNTIDFVYLFISCWYNLSLLSSHIGKYFLYSSTFST